MNPNLLIKRIIIYYLSPAELKSDQSIVNDESLSEHEQLCSQIEATMSSEQGEKKVIKKKNYNIILATVEVSKKSGLHGKRLWDKKDLCIFCDEQVTNLTRHMQRKHREEIEVAQFLSLKKGSNERKKLIDQLRKRGNFFNNISDMPKMKPVR